MFLNRFVILIYLLLGVSHAQQDCSKAAKLMASAGVLGARTSGSNEMLEEAYSLCPSSIEISYNYGVYLTSNRSYEQAMKVFSSNSDPILDIARANLLAEMGKFDEGSEILEKVLGENPRKVEALQTLSSLEFKRKNYAESERLLRLAIQEKSDDYSLFYNLGLTLEKINRLDEAKLAFSNAIRLNSLNADVHIALSKVLLLKNEIKEALSSSEKALSVAPDNPTSWFTSGLIYQQLGDHERAIKALKKSLEIRADNTKVNLALIISEIFNKEKQSVPKLLKLYEGNEQDSDIVKAILWAFLYTGDYKNAEKFVEKFKDKVENDAVALNNLGVLNDKLGKAEEANKYFKKALGLNPNLKQAQVNISIIENN